MKTNKLIDSKTALLWTAGLFFILFFNACSKDEEEEDSATGDTVIQQVNAENENYFITKVSSRYRFQEYITSDVYISMPVSNTVPKVMFDDEECKTPDFTDNMISFNFFPEFKESYDFSITEDGKTTSGTINLPDTISNFTINGEPFQEYYDTLACDTLNLAWDCKDYDHIELSVMIYYENNNDYWDYGFILEDSTLFENECNVIIPFNIRGYDITNISFRLDVYKGSLAKKPNVSGSYGDGYMFSEINHDYYCSKND